MNFKTRRILAALSAAVCAASTAAAMPVTAEDKPGVTAVYATDFEDGDVSAFSKRGDTDTSVLGTAEDADAPSGKTVMTVTERSKGWNGPQIQVDTICEPGVRYTASCWVKAEWYNSCKLSMQYTDADGEVHYGNLAEATSSGDWKQIPETKFSFSEDMHDVFIYVEANDACNLYVDDFAIKTTPSYTIQSDVPSLKNVYADCFKIGGAVTADELSPLATKQLIMKHYNSITLGNELKPENMLDKEACQALAADGDETAVAVSLKGNARTILNFCRDNNMPVRGHVLVWHSQTPGWFFKVGYDPEGDWVDKETMLGRMENYIKNVLGVIDEEYPDVEFYAWDVVNEAWLDDGKPRQPGTYEESGNYSGWTAVFGDNSFIPYAFKYARKYARPETKLYYNDFNEYMPQKTDAIIAMIDEINKDGQYIDGIGMQSHLAVMNNDTTEPFPSVSVYKKALDKFCATGLDVQITEMDATLSKNLAVTDEQLALQAQYYSDLMDCIVAQKDHVSAVVFWGTTDDMSWRAWGSPLLFNEDYTVKPCFESIVDGLQEVGTEPTDYEPATKPTETTEVTEVTETTETTEDSKPATGDVLLGDVDGNNKIELLDVIMLNKSLLGMVELEDTQMIAADVDRSGSPDSSDSLFILKYTVSLIADFAEIAVK
ncbi:MAG: endo-1,4-beta-xylanase [Oscillospiraceae bacterium]|nr:endo-1,4-beta-xylanase [Oscillospiraceae bacterium]